jgi:hypothetical protein
MGLTLALRTGSEPLSLVFAVRAQVAGPAQNLPTYAVRGMERCPGAPVNSESARRATRSILSSPCSASDRVRRFLRGITQ